MKNLWMHEVVKVILYVLKKKKKNASEKNKGESAS